MRIAALASNIADTNLPYYILYHAILPTHPLAYSKGIALSQMYNKKAGMNFSASEEYGPIILKQLISKNLPKNSVINVNFPAVDKNQVKGTKFVALDSHKLSDNIEYNVGSSEFRIGPLITKEHQVEGSDLFYLKMGYISVTPLSLNVTDYKSLKKMCEIFE